MGNSAIGRGTAVEENKVKASSGDSSPGFLEDKVDGSTIQVIGNQLVASGGETIKAWILFDGKGVISIKDSFNVSGIVDNAIGKYRVDWDTDFANNNYASVSFGFDSVSSRFMQRTSQGVGFVELESRIIGTEANLDEDGIAVIAIGDQ